MLPRPEQHAADGCGMGGCACISNGEYRESDAERLENLAYERYSASREHACAQALQEGWCQAAEFLEQKAGAAFIAMEDERARALRSLGRDLRNEAKRLDPIIREKLHAAAEAETAHIDMMDALEAQKERDAESV